MLFPISISTVLLALSSFQPLFATASASEFPIVDGVVGGVPSQFNVTNPNAAPLSKGSARDGARIPPGPTPGKLRVVENSGVCETTPGIYQASGYADLTEKQSIFFWFFAARNDPVKVDGEEKDAPLALWFNGGPGSSSLIGLFQEHGPCFIANDSSSVRHNPYSWNTNANVLYIDQPVGVGFSYGETVVGTSHRAAQDVWSFLQIWLADARFAKYAGRRVALWAESYGGHYAPAFAAHILRQNALIEAGVSAMDGQKKVRLEVVGIGNGLTDPAAQYPAYPIYAKSNPYHPLVGDAAIQRANGSVWSAGGCLEQIKQCNHPTQGTDAVCSRAQSWCNNNVLSPLAGVWNMYFVPHKTPDSYPADIVPYLSSPSIRNAIGAEVSWTKTNSAVYSNFARTGDWMRSSNPDLEYVLGVGRNASTTDPEGGVRVFIFAGDADYIVNYIGIEAMVESLETPQTPSYHSQPWSDYLVDGQTAGQFKQSDDGLLSYLRVYGAGHLVPAYKYGTLDYGQAALQMFDQITSSGQGLFST